MNQPSNDKWYSKLLTPQTVIYLAGGVVALVIFWIRTQESWVKLKEVEARVDRIAVYKSDESETKAIDEKVNKQYTTLREMTERIVNAEKWIEYHKGYEQARKDYGIK